MAQLPDIGAPAGAENPGLRHGWRVMAALSLLGLAAVVWTIVCTAPAIYWNPPRLAASFALARGLNLYPGATDGAQLGWFYPPGFAIWYLPVTLLHNPTTIIVAAALLNFATIAGPLLWLLRLAGNSWPAAFAGTMTGVVLWLANDVTHLAFYWVHVDAVCLAFGLGASGATWRFARTKSTAWLHLAAVCIVGAMFTKQLAIVLPVACSGWLATSGNPRLAVRLFCWSLLYGAVAAVACMRFWGVGETYFAMALIQARTPSWGGWNLFGSNLWALALGLPLWALVALSVWRSRHPATTSPGLGSLLLWVALAHAPLGLYAPLKLGGGLNSLHTLPYLAALLAVAMGRRWDETAATGASAATRWRFAGLWLAGILLAHAHGADRRVNWRIDHGQEEQLALARAHVGRIYLPWNPLITILTENKIYPFDNALFCLASAGMSPPADAIRAAVPRHALLVFPEQCQSKFVLNYLFPPPPANALPAQ